MSNTVITYNPIKNEAESKGVLFFNIGSNCLLRTFVAIYTLRKHYEGDAAILLSKNDEHSQFVIDNMKTFDIQPHWYEPIVECKRNTGYTIKPHVIEQSPFDVTLYSDTDVIFKDDPSELFDITRKHNLVFTPYRDWVTTGKGMSRRIKKLSDIIPPDQIQASLDYGTALNTGVLGFTRNNTQAFFKDWIETTLKGEGRFIIDELVCQCICHKYPHALVSNEWNYSCRENDCSPGKIIHFHGRKHARPERYKNSILWIEQFNLLRNSGILSDETMKQLIQFDRYVRRYEKSL